ncbi:unnamed protein product [Effrenium voratum]|nr:unnamed protein product [Effrenium voratum]
MGTVAVDLRTPGQERLQLSGEPPGTASASAAVPMVDLRRNGAPLRYYAVQAKGLRVAGEPLDVGPLVAVLDTGTTGLGMPSGLFARYDKLRRQKASELGLRRAQAVDILLQKEDGSELSLSLLPGRQSGYGQDRFDIVTPLPEPSGMTADASALWTGEGHIGAKPMQLSNRGLVAEAPGNGVGWAQADRPLSQGDRFLVRLLPSKGRGQSAACSGWLGLAPRGACLQGEEDTSAYGGWASEGKLRAGDLIECRLADDGSGTVFWRVNGGQAITSKEPLATARMVYPTVELAEGCDVELLSTPIPSPLEREQSMSWAAPPSEEAKDRPTLVFLGLGFLLGRKMSIDTVANRVIFT